MQLEYYTYTLLLKMFNSEQSYPSNIYAGLCVVPMCSVATPFSAVRGLAPVTTLLRFDVSQCACTYLEEKYRP